MTEPVKIAEREKRRESQSNFARPRRLDRVAHADHVFPPGHHHFLGDANALHLVRPDGGVSQFKLSEESPARRMKGVVELVDGKFEERVMIAVEGDNLSNP